MEAMERFRPPQPTAQEQRRNEAAENAMFRFDVRRSLRLHRRVAVVVAAVVFVALLSLILRSHKGYSSECIVSVAPTAPKIMNEGTPAWGTDSQTYDTLLEQQIQLAKRYDVLAKSLTSPGVTFRGPQESEQAAVERLSRATTAERIGKSYQISISVTTSNPQQASLLANAITNNFITASHDDAISQNSERVKALKTERAQLQATLDAKIAQQSALLQQIGMVSGGTTTADADFIQLSSAAAQAKLKHDEASAHLNSLNLPGAVPSSANDVPNFTPNMLIEQRSTLQAQMAGLTPNNPLYKSDQQQLADIEKQISAGEGLTRANALAKAQAQARTELAEATATQASVSGALAAKAAKVSKNTPQIQQSNALAADIQRLEARYAVVDDRTRNMELENGNVGILDLTTSARPPLAANPNHRLLLLMMLLPAPILAGLLAAMFALKFDQRIYSSADIEAVTGYPPFAVLLNRHESSAEVMEEYLLRMAAGVESLHTTRRVRTVLVTAVASKGGASSIVTALALKLQQINRESAVLDVEAEEVNITQEELAALAEKHSLVLIDSTPLLSSARSEYLARFADAVMLVVESGITRRAELRRAMQLLEKLHAHGVAVVLNKVNLASAEDAVRREVLEVEHRLLNRDATAYARPALRLYNTTPQDNILNLSAEVIRPEDEAEGKTLDQKVQPSTDDSQTKAAHAVGKGTPSLEQKKEQQSDSVAPPTTAASSSPEAPSASAAELNTGTPSESQGNPAEPLSKNPLTLDAGLPDQPSAPQRPRVQRPQAGAAIPQSDETPTTSKRPAAPRQLAESPAQPEGDFAAASHTTQMATSARFLPAVLPGIALAASAPTAAPSLRESASPPRETRRQVVPSLYSGTAAPLLPPQLPVAPAQTSIPTQQPTPAQSQPSSVPSAKFSERAFAEPEFTAPHAKATPSALPDSLPLSPVVAALSTPTGNQHLEVQAEPLPVPRRYIESDPVRAADRYPSTPPRELQRLVPQRNASGARGGRPEDIAPMLSPTLEPSHDYIRGRTRLLDEARARQSSGGRSGGPEFYDPSSRQPSGTAPPKAPAQSRPPAPVLRAVPNPVFDPAVDIAPYPTRDEGSYQKHQMRPEIQPEAPPQVRPDQRAVAKSEVRGTEEPDTDSQPDAPTEELIARSAGKPARRLFQFPWRSKTGPRKDPASEAQLAVNAPPLPSPRSPEDETAISSARAAAARSRTEQMRQPEPVRKVSAYETYIPSPSAGWRPKKDNSSHDGKGKNQGKAKWMDRAEVERHILGSSKRRKD